jgi:hypothetical protein
MSAPFPVLIKRILFATDFSRVSLLRCRTLWP